MNTEEQYQSGGRASRILIVDDHELMRQGVIRVIADEPDLAVCGEAASVKDAVRLVDELAPDLVVSDITLCGGNGIELCTILRERWPDLPVLVVSVHDEAIYARRVIAAGALGYVMKSAPASAVVSGIRRVLAGQIALSPRATQMLLRGMSGRAVTEGIGQGLGRFTDRELECFVMVGEGYGVSEIAERMCISPKTVETYKEHIKQKLGLSSHGELLRHAISVRVVLGT